MTEQETIKIVTLIVMSYPTTDKFNENTVKAMVGVWKQMFKDDNPRIVELAVQKHIATNKWVPSVAEIREIIAEISNPDLIPPDEAWAVFENFRRKNTNWMWMLDELPPLIATAVSNMGCRSDCPGVEIYREFMKLYTPAYDRAMKQAMIPKAIRSGIQSIRESKEKALLEGAQDA